MTSIDSYNFTVLQPRKICFLPSRPSHWRNCGKAGGKRGAVMQSNAFFDLFYCHLSSLSGMLSDAIQTAVKQDRKCWLRSPNFLFCCYNSRAPICRSRLLGQILRCRVGLQGDSVRGARPPSPSPLPCRQASITYFSQEAELAKKVEVGRFPKIRIR